MLFLYLNIHHILFTTRIVGRHPLFSSISRESLDSSHPHLFSALSQPSHQMSVHSSTDSFDIYFLSTSTSQFHRLSCCLNNSFPSWIVFFFLSVSSFPIFHPLNISSLGRYFSCIQEQTNVNCR